MLIIRIIENIKVSCNQTGKIIKASIDELSKETSEDLELADIFDSNEVIYEAKDGKTYDVTIKNGSVTGLFCVPHFVHYYTQWPLCSLCLRITII